MNTKGMKFLAVLAVLTMAFAAVSFLSVSDEQYEAANSELSGDITTDTTIAAGDTATLTGAVSLTAKLTVKGTLVLSTYALTISEGGQLIVDGGKVTGLNANNNIRAITASKDVVIVKNGGIFGYYESTNGKMNEYTNSVVICNAANVDSSTSVFVLQDVTGEFTISTDANKILGIRGTVNAATVESKVLVPRISNYLDAFSTGDVTIGAGVYFLPGAFKISANTTLTVAGVVSTDAKPRAGVIEASQLIIKDNGTYKVTGNAFGKISYGTDSVILDIKDVICKDDEVYTTLLGLSGFTVHKTASAIELYGALVNNSEGTITLDVDSDVVIPSSKTLTVPEDVELVNNAKMTVNGSVIVEGKFTNYNAEPSTTMGVVTGTGKVDIYGTYTSGRFAPQGQSTICTVNAYAGATWNGNGSVVYASTNDSTPVFTIPAAGSSPVKVFTFKQTVDSNNAITAASFTAYANVIVNKGAWFNNGYADTAVIESGVITIGEALTLDEKDILTLKEDASLAGSATLTNNGIINLAAADQLYAHITNNKTINIAGSKATESAATGDVTETAVNSTTIYTQAITSIKTSEGSTAVIEDPSAIATVDVTAAGSAVTLQGLSSKAFTLKIGDKTVEFSGMTGTVTVSKGSIVVDGKDWTGGTINLNSGDELKLKGDITSGTVTINLASGTASVIIEKETTLNNAGAISITGSGKVAFKIFGTMTSTSTSTGGITGADSIVVYSGADLSGYLNTTTLALISGADENGGTWTWTAGTATLTLNKYNGTPTFIDVLKTATITNLILVGSNTVTMSDVDLSKGNVTVFNGGTALTISNYSGLASLAITADITKDDSTKEFIAISGTAVTITGVDVSITVTGSATKVTGIKATESTTVAVTIFNSMTVITVNPSTYKSANVYGIYSAGDVSIQASELEVISGYIGVYAYGKDVEVKASKFVSTASQNGIIADDMSISQSSITEFKALALTPGQSTPANALSLSGKLDNLSFSTVTADSIYVGDDVTNYATINNTGNAVFAKAFKNQTDGVLNNSGFIGMYGTMTVSDGKVNNTGTITTYAKPAGAAVAETSTISGTGVYVTSIEIAAPTGSSLLNANGKLYVDATVHLDGIATAIHYYGYASFDKNGTMTDASLTNIKYDDSGVQYVSTVIITSAPVASSDNYIYTLVTGGTYYNGESSVSTTGSAKIGATGVGAALAIRGALSTTDNPAVTVNGGEIVNDGTIAVNIDSDLVTDGKLTNNGTLTLDANVNVKKGTLINNGTLSVNKNLTMSNSAKLDGDFTVKDGSVITVSGTIDSKITYTGEYTATGASTKTTFTNIITVDAKGTGFVITATAGSAAPGTFDFTNMDKFDPKTDSAIYIMQGKAILSGDLATKAVITAVKDTTIQIAGSSTINGVLAIQDGAKFNRWIDGDTSTYTYGKATYVIEFANDGCTYYGNLAFALANAPENAKMTLSSNTSITSDTTVKKGVELTFAENVTLTIAGTGTEDKSIVFDMDEGAKFILTSGSVISFKYVTASADIFYGLNEMSLDGVVFDEATASTIAVTPGTATAPAGFNVAFLDTDKGTVQFDVGYSYGTIVLDAVLETGSETSVEKAGYVVIDDLAVSNVVISKGDNDYKKAGIFVYGDLKIASDATMDIPMSGYGDVILGNNVTLTSVYNVPISVTIGNGTDGYTLYEALDNGTATLEAPYTIKSVPATSTAAAYVLLSGKILDGSATAVGNVAASELTIMTDGDKKVASVIVPVDTTLTVLSTAGDSVTVNGLLKVAGTMNYYTSETTSYGKVAYQVTYVEGLYTVFTTLSTASSNAPAGTSIAVGKNLVLDKHTTISKDVSIVVEDDYYIQVPAGGYLIIGEGLTDLGYASVLTGNVVLGAQSYVIDFSGSGSEIYVYTNTAMTTEAKENYFLVLDTLYATVYAESDMALAAVDDNGAGTYYINVNNVKPAIDGYYFNVWKLQNENPISATVTKLSDGPFVGDLVASKVSVTFKTVDGVNYYVDGEIINTLDAPYKVKYGATITAKNANPSAYTGTPLVNGKAYIIVDDSLTSVTASGVSPIQPEPTPEPEKASEWNVTTILLVILVILIAIMAVIVALRLNRS